jgi:hypothetical protein
MSAGIGFERLPILNGSELRMVSRDGLACDLAQIVSQPIFDIPRLVKASRDQRLDPLTGIPERLNRSGNNNSEDRPHKPKAKAKNNPV